MGTGGRHCWALMGGTDGHCSTHTIGGRGRLTTHGTPGQ
ncbi:unnamed protein product [Staurois parvus]|uniref:Uncharacterized protein n=1 Tax=Staurois parvus TaxID=386267 RepID=A0ABN9EY76_9NEOB|nr:unnamed protein product [Staurois parvus]